MTNPQAWESAAAVGLNSYTIRRSETEIEGQLNKASEQIDAGGSAYPGKTYEEGVSEALGWLLGLSADAPLEA